MVRVMSRHECVSYCNQSHNTPSLIISISTPYRQYDWKPEITDTNGVKNILRLAFNDTDLLDDIRPISDRDAERIKAFLQENWSDDVLLIVHCDAGQSRSAGVAAAILKATTGDDSEIFDKPRFIPNMLVYRTVLQELYAKPKFSIRKE